MSTHVFDQAVAMELQADGTFVGHTNPAYANMVGPFGGISAAQMMNAVLLHPQRLGEPVSLTINFAAALSHPDGHFKFPRLWPVKFPQARRLNYRFFAMAGSNFLFW